MHFHVFFRLDTGYNPYSERISLAEKMPLVDKISLGNFENMRTVYAHLPHSLYQN